MKRTLEESFYRHVWRSGALARRQRLRRVSAEDGGGSSPTASAVAADPASEDTFEERRSAEPISADKVAIGLTFARALDAQPFLVRELKTGGPIFIVEVPDETFARAFKEVWATAAFGPDGDQDPAARRATTFIPPPPSKSVSDFAAGELRDAILRGYPVVAITVSPQSLPPFVLTAETARVSLAEIDARTVALTIRAVAGRRPRKGTADDSGMPTGMVLATAVRFDRTPEECVELLQRKSKRAAAQSETLRLEDLHGMKEVRAWADTVLEDLAAWRRGEIKWSETENAAVVQGPTGSGKTQLAKSLSQAARLPLFACSYSKWQAAGEAHLGTCLRDMRADFAKARAAPSILFIDELDSFPDRQRSRSLHYDQYMIAVVNALLEEIDGLAGRRGVILLGATNELSRVDTALLRPGRFGRILRIGMPDPDEILPMLRVRLGDDLKSQDLTAAVRYAAAKSGAEIERAVGDARRFARRERRAMAYGDLIRALNGEPVDDPVLAKLVSYHEAGHIIVCVLLRGATGVNAVMGGGGGLVSQLGQVRGLGTYREYHNAIQIVLAGRAAEEIVFGTASDGAGGRSGSDLHSATVIAASAVGSVCVAGTSLLRVGGVNDTDLILGYPELRRAARDEVQKASEAVSKLLSERRFSLDMVAERLLRDGHVSGEEVDRILRDNSILEFQLEP